MAHVPRAAMAAQEAPVVVRAVPVAVLAVLVAVPEVPAVTLAVVQAVPVVALVEPVVALVEPVAALVVPVAVLEAPVVVPVEPAAGLAVLAVKAAAGAEDTIADCSGLAIPSLNNASTVQTHWYTGHAVLQTNPWLVAKLITTAPTTSSVYSTCSRVDLFNRRDRLRHSALCSTVCEDRETELDCNDDSGGLQSTISIDVANQTIYLVVDTYDEEEPHAEECPECSDCDATHCCGAQYVPTRLSFGLVIEGNDPASDAVAFELTLLMQQESRSSERRWALI